MSGATPNPILELLNKAELTARPRLPSALAALPLFRALAAQPYVMAKTNTQPRPSAGSALGTGTDVAVGNSTLGPFVGITRQYPYLQILLKAAQRANPAYSHVIYAALRTAPYVIAQTNVQTEPTIVAAPGFVSATGTDVTVGLQAATAAAASSSAIGTDIAVGAQAAATAAASSSATGTDVAVGQQQDTTASAFAAATGTDVAVGQQQAATAAASAAASGTDIAVGLQAVTSVAALSAATGTDVAVGVQVPSSTVASVADAAATVLMISPSGTIASGAGLATGDASGTSAGNSSTPYVPPPPAIVVTDWIESGGGGGDRHHRMAFKTKRQRQERRDRDDLAVLAPHIIAHLQSNGRNHAAHN